MSTMNDPTADAKAIVDITREAVGGKLHPIEDRNQLYVTVLPNDYKLATVDMREFGAFPERQRGTVVTQTVQDFARYVERHDDIHRTTVWVDLERHRVVAVLDDHAPSSGTEDLYDTAGWGEHRAELGLILTDEWKHWARHDATLLEQEQFAEHVQDGMQDIADPPAADLLEIVQTMQGKTNAEWKSAKRLSDGQTQLAYHEEATATAGGNGELQIPDRFVLGIAPFVGEDAYRLEAHLRYRVSSGKLKIGYKLIRPNDVVRSAVDDIATRLAAQFVDRVFVGRPRS